MATVNFSVPDEVKEAFDRTFKGCNKSALIADFMRGAVADEKRRRQLKRRRNQMMREIQEIARAGEPVSDDEIRALREEGRP